MKTETLIIIGARGLGRTIALHFAAQRWQVVCAARTQADVDRLAGEVAAAGGRGIPVVCDLTDPPSLAALTSACEHIDLCVAAQTSGVRFGARPLLEIDDDELDRGFRGYVRATWNLLKAVGPRLVAQQS